MTNALRDVIHHLTSTVGRRTISDCVPLLIPTQLPELKVMVHLYSKKGKRYALPEVWVMIRNVGVTRAPRELKEGAISRLRASGIEVE